MRSKLFFLVALVVCAASLLTSWSQTWFTFPVNFASTSQVELSVSGSVVAPALSSFGLALCAVVAVLALAKGWLRYLLGIVLIVIAVLAGLAAVTALSNPLGAALPAFTKLSGLTAAAAIAPFVGAPVVGWAPYLALTTSLVATLLGIWALLSIRSWRGSGTSKYDRGARDHQRTSVAAPESVSLGERSISDWDELSTGTDPTIR